MTPCRPAPVLTTVAGARVCRACTWSRRRDRLAATGSGLRRASQLEWPPTYALAVLAQCARGYRWIRASVVPLRRRELAVGFWAKLTSRIQAPACSVDDEEDDKHIAAVPVREQRTKHV